MLRDRAPQFAASVAFGEILQVTRNRVSVEDLDGAGPSRFFGGPSDVFVSRFDAFGAQKWVRQLGSPDWEESYSVAVTSGNRPVVGGSTDGTIWGHANAGGTDSFLTVLPR